MLADATVGLLGGHIRPNRHRAPEHQGAGMPASRVRPGTSRPLSVTGDELVGSMDDGRPHAGSARHKCARPLDELLAAV